MKAVMEEQYKEKTARAEAIPDVSVIMTTYNRACLVERALKSVLAQTYRNFEVILVDDGSTDNTAELIKGINSSRVKYIYQDHAGAPAAANRGIRLARGKYIAFLDSDDEWLPDKLKIQMEFFRQEPAGTGVVYSPVNWTEEGGESRILEPRAEKRDGHIKRELLVSSHVLLGSAIIKRECFESVGLLDERLSNYNDWDLWIRISGHYMFKYIPRPLLNVNSLPDSMSKDIESLIESSEIIFEKHKSDFGNLKPALLASRYCFLGGIFFLAGETGKGREFILKALKSDPFNIVYIISYTLTFFGRNIYKWCLSVRKSPVIWFLNQTG